MNEVTGDYSAERTLDRHGLTLNCHAKNPQCQRARIIDLGLRLLC